MATQQDDFGDSFSSPFSRSKSSSSSRYTHDVFLSFRGSDHVRYEFADLLYHALKDAALNMFREEDVVEKGAELGRDINKAIWESKVAIVIFSGHFASSTDLLDQVAMLMERRTRGKVQVLPVFFKVDPDDVSQLRGRYRESFKRREEDWKKRFEGAQREELMRKQAAWKAALQQAADLAGFHYQGDRSLSPFITDVVAAARRLANVVMLDIPSHVVGQPYRFSTLEKWVQDRSHDKRIALLHGPRGIGKKTMAIVVCNQNYDDFDATAFLENVAEKSKKPYGIVDLQNQLLTILNPERLEGNSSIPSEREGMLMIQEGIQNKRVLIMLANLDDAEQFFKFIGKPEYLGKGSKVIVTSGDEKLLHDDLSIKFAVGPLTPAQSLELFSRHVFGTARPAEGYEGRAVASLRPYFGNPSALRAYASLVKALGEDSWDELLLDKNEDDIKSSIDAKNDLKASYDSLEQIDKELFLDMTCFYAGWDRDHVDSVINNVNMYKKGGFDRLRRRNLVAVDMDNKVTMSEPIMDMGIEIVRQKTDSVEKCSNIWYPEDACRILREQIGTAHIRSFVLDGSRVQTREMEFRTEAFAGMTDLKLLQLVNIKLKGDFEDFPKKLVSFSWEAMSLHRMPENIRLEYLLNLDLRNSGLKRLWNGSRYFRRLKILNLSHSHMLERTPNFRRLRVPMLERLILEGCSRLVEIHPSIQDLKRLVLLNLKGCASLEELSVVGSPSILDISNCTALRVMPNTRIESVKELRAHQIQVDQLLCESPHLSLNAVFPRLHKSSLVSCQPSWGLDLPKDLDLLKDLDLPNDLDLSNDLDLPNDLDLMKDVYHSEDLNQSTDLNDSEDLYLPKDLDLPTYLDLLKDDLRRYLLTSLGEKLRHFLGLTGTFLVLVLLFACLFSFLSRRNL